MDTKTIKNPLSHHQLPAAYLAYQQRASQQLDILLTTQWLPAHPRMQQLHDAIAYVIQGEGKRLRPLLVYATGSALSIPLHQLDAAACAIELIHAYSLVHDDLPAMDNDDFRRGKPTCHKAFGESTAILAGDALQTLAFELLSDAESNPLSAEQRVTQIAALTKASGIAGMIGGQMIDLMSAGDLTLNEATLQKMYSCKTGALIRVSVELALIAAPTPLNPKLQSALLHFAEIIGLAFQIKDDLLDLIGSDISQDKMTFPRLLGIDKTQEKLNQLLQSAEQLISPFPAPKSKLMPIAQFCIERST